MVPASRVLARFLQELVQRVYAVALQRRLEMRVGSHTEIDTVLALDGANVRVVALATKFAVGVPRSDSVHSRCIFGHQSGFLSDP